jgi:hypothetical protein
MRKRRISIQDDAFVIFHVFFVFLPFNTTTTTTTLYETFDTPQPLLTMQAALHPIVGPKKEITDLHGRTAVVLGGANGIGQYHLIFFRIVLMLLGFQISRAFALEGCHVIMINRKEDQGQASIDDIKKEKADARVEWEGCDLGSLKDVKQVFTSLRERLDRCDLVRQLLRTCVRTC